MLVLKSTRDQMVAEARAAGAAALSELVGELTDGLRTLGLRAEPKPGETTAAMVLRYLKAQMVATEQFREEVAETRATLSAANAKLARLTTRGPGGRFVNPAKPTAVKVTPLTAGEDVAQERRWDRQQAF